MESVDSVFEFLIMLKKIYKFIKVDIKNDFCILRTKNNFKIALTKLKVDIKRELIIVVI
jgi:hypothetical protein